MADFEEMFVYEEDEGVEWIDCFLSNEDFFQPGEKRRRSDRDDEDDMDSDHPIKVPKLGELDFDLQFSAVLRMLANDEEPNPATVVHQPEQLHGDTFDESVFDILNDYQEHVAPIAQQSEQSVQSAQVQPPAEQGKVQARSKYVRMCQHFERPDRSVLTEAFIMNVMHQEFPQYAHEWCATLQSSPQHRAILVQKKSRDKDPSIKLLFCLLSCVYFFQSTAGDELWNNRQAGFSAAFQGTVVRVLSDRVQFAETFRRNPLLMDSLRDSFAYLKHLYTIMGLRRNVCFLLMVVSCVEGRGVYHGRTSNGFSVPYKSYRYMIETLGGRVLAAIADDPEIKPLIELFEKI